MAFEIKMPQLSDTMNAGKILAWKKNVGDTIKRGDILAEVETEKANLEIESFQNGILLEIRNPAGQTATVGDIICVIGAAGEKTASATAQAPVETPKPVLVQQAPVSTNTVPAYTASSATAATDDRVKASPLAKKIAQQKNIDLTLIAGSGPNGRIVRKDIEGDNQVMQTSNTALAVEESVPQQKAEAPKQTFTPMTGGKLVPFSKMRQVIADRMQKSVQESPHFYVSTSIAMDEATKLREFLKEKPGFKGISINHLVLKACAYAIEQEPSVNNAVRDGQIYVPDGINVGIVATIGEGLMIPVIHNANKLPLKDLVFEARAALDRAKAGRPTSQDLSGGTFSVSNMGMFDVESFTAIINPGQGGIIAVSSTKDTAVVKNGAITIAKMMKVTASVDHRIIDGVMAAKFLGHFKDALENPAIMLV